MWIDFKNRVKRGLRGVLSHRWTSEVFLFLRATAAAKARPCEPQRWQVRQFGWKQPGKEMRDFTASTTDSSHNASLRRKGSRGWTRQTPSLTSSGRVKLTFFIVSDELLCRRLSDILEALRAIPRGRLRQTPWLLLFVKPPATAIFPDTRFPSVLRSRFSPENYLQIVKLKSTLRDKPPPMNHLIWSSKWALTFCPSFLMLWAKC